MSDSAYLNRLEDRVLVYDGAMGTSIQTLGLTADDFGGPELEGCNDNLVFTRPELVCDIHASFLEVGCDVVETGTFRANRLSVAEYGLQYRIVELNRAGRRWGVAGRVVPWLAVTVVLASGCSGGTRPPATPLTRRRGPQRPRRRLFSGFATPNR